MAVVGAAAVYVLAAANRHWLEALSELSPTLVLAALVLIIAVVAYWMRDGQTHLQSGLRHVHAYPPAWLGGTLGTALLLVGLSYSTEARSLLQLPGDAAAPLRAIGSTLASLLLLVVGGSIGVHLWQRMRSQKRELEERSDAQDNESRQALAPLQASWPQLRAWLANDAPVTQPEDDAFGHLPIARRIAQRLRAKPMPTQVVVGDLGAGKTTLRHLVQHELEPHNWIHIVPVELWPYDTPTAAVEGVLRTLLDAVSKEASVLAVRGLPERYAAAMGAAGSLSSTLADLAGKARAPFDVLEGVDRIAETIGHRFVVWVEDLERFAGSAAGDESLEQSHRLAPLRALLFGLSERTSIGVVTATISLHARFDTEKIARFIEELPVLEPIAAIRILRGFREACLAEPFIDPALPDAREGWAGFDTLEAQESRAAYGGRIQFVVEAAAFLCRTPRSMKHALRHAMSSWESLRGEIDFDDLLLMHLLRVAEPTVFAVVRNHWYGASGWPKAERAREETRKAFEDALTALSLDDERAGAVNVILRSVFPEHHVSHAKPQGLAIRRYWLRFLSEPELSLRDRDQLILQTLRRDDDSAIIDILETEQSRQLAGFPRELPGERLLRLLVPLVRRRARESPTAWGERSLGVPSSPPGVIYLSYLIDSRRSAEPPSAEALCNELIRAFQEGISNLHLIRALDHWYASPNETGRLYGNGIDDGKPLVAKAREALWALLTEEFEGKPDALVEALRDSSPRTLAQVVWGALRFERNARTGIPFPNWTGLAATILAACRDAPDVMLAQVAALVTRERDILWESGRPPPYEFDPEHARELFGDTVAVLRLFRQPADIPPDPSGMVDAVAKAAADFNWDTEQDTAR